MELAFEGFARGVEPGRGGRAAEPVRRYSRPQGRCEGVFWRPFKPRDVARYLTAAERFERAGKKPGDRCGPLGTVAIEILRELLRLVDYRTGRLDPALTTLMARTKRSKDAVVRALAALRRHGFVDWLRRYIPTGNLGAGPHPTYQRLGLLVPVRFAALIGRIVDQGGGDAGVLALGIDAEDRAIGGQKVGDDGAHALARAGRGDGQKMGLAGVAEELATLAIFTPNDQSGRAAEGAFDLVRAGEMRRAVDAASGGGEGEFFIEPSKAADSANDAGGDSDDRFKRLLDVRHGEDRN